MHHQTRLFECADKILADREIYRGLPADRGVDHRGQRCRNLDNGNAAKPGSGNEADEVGCYATTHADQAVGAFGALFGQPFVNFGRRLDVLGRLTEFKDQCVGLVAGAFQSFVCAANQQRKH